MKRTHEGVIRELDHRSQNGIDVWLLWDSATNRVAIAVEDEHSGESLCFEVGGAEALAAFHHPYVYAEPTPHPLPVQTHTPPGMTR